MTFAALQQRHEALLARQDALGADELRGKTPAAAQLQQDAQQFVADAVAASEDVGDPRQRDQLRAYLRYWATFIYDGTGVFPKTDLRPAKLVAARPEGIDPGGDAQRRARSRGLPGWVWALAGLLALLLLAAAFTLTRFGLATGEDVNGELPGDSTPTTPMPAITRTPPPPPTTGEFIPIDRDNAGGVAAAGQVDAHTGGVLDVAFDPTKPEIASAGADGIVRFWTLPNLTLSRQLNDQRGWVRTIAYSPLFERDRLASALLLTGGNDRVLRTYDVETLQPFAEFLPSSANSGFVFAATFSPDGRLIASGHGDGVARIWDVGGGTESQSLPRDPINSRLAQIPSGASAVNDVAFAGDDDDDDDHPFLALALSGTEFGVQIMDPSFSQPVCAYPTGTALAVTFSPGGDVLAAGLEDGRLLLVDIDDCRVYSEAMAHEGGVTGIAFGPQGDWLVTGGRDGTLKIWMPDDATETWRGEAGSAVEAVAVEPEGRYVASAGADGRLILWGVP